MALLEIKKAGDPVLKEICKPIEKIDKRLRNLLDDMAERERGRRDCRAASRRFDSRLRRRR